MKIIFNLFKRMKEGLEILEDLEILEYPRIS